MSDSTQQNIANELFESAKNLISGDNLTISNVITLATSLMKSVEKYSDLTGADKKSIVIMVIGRVAEELPQGTSKDMFNTAIPVLPDIIDTIISIDKGDIKIKAKKIWVKIRGMCC